MNTLISALKSKTILFSILLSVLSVAQGYVGLFILDQKGQAIAGMAIAGVVALLRAVTTMPLADK